MTDDGIKKRILARRAQLVMAALSTMACEPQETRPAVCLEPIVLPPDDAGAPKAEIPPQVCLEPMRRTDDEEDDVAPDAGTKDAGPRPIPVPCLSPLPPPKVKPAPTVCLYIKK